jgi:transcriptional regulator with XRE-family HTH domain
MSKMLSMPRPRVENQETGLEEWGENPTVGQFTAAPPTPYIEQVRFYSQEFGREIGVPANYLGFITENPASADAIRAGEQRLTARTRRRQRGLTKPCREVARNIVMVRDGEDRMLAALETLRKITPNWADPSVTTPTAAVDEAIKLTSGDTPIVPPESRVLLERIGMSKQQIARIEEDRRRFRQQQRIVAGQQARQRAVAPAGAPVGDTRPGTLPGNTPDVAR